MLNQDTDQWGYPTDPEIRQLLFRLGDLAAVYRETSDNPPRQDEAVRAYHATLHRLEELGWHGIIDWDSELPNDVMPTAYQRDPRIRTNWSFPKQARNGT
jgi:hypothetical protein